MDDNAGPPTPITPDQTLAFVERHGIVLESARGPVSSLAEAIAGESISGSWWPHPRSHAIFEAINAARGSADVLVCRLVGGKVTFVHRRLWPALARLEDRFDADQLAALEEVHTASGAHRVQTIPFVQRIPIETLYAADALSEADALEQLTACWPNLVL